MSEYIGWLNTAGEAFVLCVSRMLVQSSVLIVILLLLDLALRRRVRAVIRYWIWLLVLVKLLLPPSLSSPVSLISWLDHQLPEAATAPLLLRAPVVARDVIEAPLPMPMEAAPLPPATDFPTADEVPLPVVATPLTIPPTWQAMVLLAWAAAAILMLLLLLQHASFVRALMAPSQETPGDLRALLEQYRQ